MTQSIRRASVASILALSNSLLLRFVTLLLTTFNSSNRTTQALERIRRQDE
jgi:hypothetical protein